MKNIQFTIVGLVLLCVSAITVGAQKLSPEETQLKATREIVQAYENFAVANGFYPEDLDVKELLAEGFLAEDSLAAEYVLHDPAKDSEVKDEKESFYARVVRCEDRVAVFSASAELEVEKVHAQWWDENNCAKEKKLNYFVLSSEGLLLLEMDDLGLEQEEAFIEEDAMKPENSIDKESGKQEGAEDDIEEGGLNESPNNLIEEVRKVDEEGDMSESLTSADPENTTVFEKAEEGQEGILDELPFSEGIIEDSLRLETTDDGANLEIYEQSEGIIVVEGAFFPGDNEEVNQESMASDESQENEVYKTNNDSAEREEDNPTTADDENMSGDTM